jgi:cytochrome c
MWSDGEAGLTTRKQMGFVTLSLVGALADWANSQCTLPATNQLSKVEVVARSSGQLNRPSQMSILANGDIFLAEMWSGKIKLWEAATSKVTEIGTIDVYRDNSGAQGAGVENGLLGIAAHPQYATNHWIYVFFSNKISDAAHSAGDGNIREHEHVLRRYTVTGGKLTNPKDMLKFGRESARHAAGGMTFNKATGDLFITTGDDTYPGSAQTQYGGRNETSDYLNSLRSSANTNDLRGKVLRIHPLPFADTENPGVGPGKSYSIPAGNLFPEGTAKTRPEIFTMGHRNPYRVGVDAGSGAAIIGEVGPDARSTDASKGTIGLDEFSLATEAANFGWPFANGNNLMYTAIAGEVYPVGTKFEANALKNLSKFNTGLQDLPPAKPALVYYASGQNAPAPFDAVNDNRGAGSAAISGPYYRYSPTATGKGRLPAYFHGKFIIGDWSRNRIWVMELDANKGLKKVEKLYNSGKVIDMDIGPGGELYVLEYGYSATGDYHGDLNSGSVYKLEFTGTHYDTTACAGTYVLPKTSTTGIGANGAFEKRGKANLVRMGHSTLVPAPAGSLTGTLFNLNGAKIWQGKVANGQLRLPNQAKESLAFLQFN